MGHPFYSVPNVSFSLGCGTLGVISYGSEWFETRLLSSLSFAVDQWFDSIFHPEGGRKHMWTCTNCNRIFEKGGQPHSCKKVSVESHFVNKIKAKDLFDHLLQQIEQNIGKCKIVSLPCCVHLFGTCDFLAVLPKKGGIEIRFALNRKLDTPRLKAFVPMSSKIFKNCFDISNKNEIDSEFMEWLKESYHLKD